MTAIVLILSFALTAIVAFSALTGSRQACKVALPLICAATCVALFASGHPVPAAIDGLGAVLWGVFPPASTRRS